MDNTPDMGNIPSPRAFTLDKVKLVKGGGLDILYKLEKNDGTFIRESEHHDKYTDNVHPDLQLKFEQLRPILGRVYGMMFFRTLMETPEFGASESQKEMFEEAVKKLLQRINVTGFALSGKDENIGIIITGTYTADNNMVMAINSHRMKFSGTTYGFESDMEDIVTAIEEEVYAYLWLGKKQELEAFDANGQAAPHVIDGKMAAAGERDEPDDDE